jgi:hypothetical protein
MNFFLKKLNILKFQKNFIFFSSVNLFLLTKSKKTFILNYQNGMNFYFYTGVKSKSFGTLLNKKFILIRKHDFTKIKFLLFSPIIIYFF